MCVCVCSPCHSLFPFFALGILPYPPQRVANCLILLFLPLWLAPILGLAAWLGAVSTLLCVVRIPAWLTKVSTQ